MSDDSDVWTDVIYLQTTIVFKIRGAVTDCVSAVGAREFTFHGHIRWVVAECQYHCELYHDRVHLATIKASPPEALKGIFKQVHEHAQALVRRKDKMKGER